MCEDGYTASNVYSPCEKCFEGGGTGQSVGFWLVIALIALYLVGGVAYYMMDMAKLKARVTRIQQFMGSTEVRVCLKLLIVYFQILAEFELVLTSNYPSSYSSFLNVAQLSNMSLGSIFSLRCFRPGFDFYDELLARTLLPIFVTAVVALYYLALMLRGSVTSQSHDQQSLKHKLI